jgi:hypothetical protein
MRTREALYKQKQTASDGAFLHVVAVEWRVSTGPNRHKRG